MLNIEEEIENGELFDGRYKMLHPLSTEGGTADVWLAIDATTIDNPDLVDGDDLQNLDESGIKVAIKIYRPQNVLDVEGEQRFRDEYKIVYNCHHTNLLQPTYFSIYKETPYLVLPYCQNGSSELLIGQMTERKDLWRYIHDVAAGLAYLHALKPPIIHQDVKPANVLIDDSGNFTITDFGISSRFSSHHGSTDAGAYSGTIAYMAPERFLNPGTMMKESDIWGFGATLYEIISGKPPFGESGGQGQINDKVKLDFGGVKVPGDIRKLVLSCLDKDPAKRPTAEQLLEAAEKATTPSKSPLLTTIFAAVAVAAIAALFFLLKPWSKESDNTVTDNTNVSTQSEEPEGVIDTVKNWRTQNWTYSGPRLDGEPHGLGEARDDAGRVYVGNFDHGRRVDKHARFTHTNGGIFEGEFVKDTIYKGRYTQPDGYYFEGTFYNNGSPYDGYWYNVDGKKEGKVEKGKTTSL